MAKWVGNDRRGWTKELPLGRLEVAKFSDPWLRLEGGVIVMLPFCLCSTVNATKAKCTQYYNKYAELSKNIKDCKQMPYAYDYMYDRTFGVRINIYKGQNTRYADIIKDKRRLFLLKGNFTDAEIIAYVEARLCLTIH